MLTFTLLCGFAPKTIPISGEIIDIDYTAQETRLSFPKTLWSIILNNLEKGTKADSLVTLPMTINFNEDKKDVLFETGYRINLSEFGGKIDYSKFVNNKKRGFLFIKFETDLAKEDLKKLKVYFLSTSKKRKVGSETVGNGCNVLMDLTDYFQKEALVKGLKVSTSQSRHLSVTAGKFYFIYPMSGFIKLAQVIFTDSTQNSLLCERLEKPTAMLGN